MIRTILLLLMLTVFTGCSNLALISSLGGVAATQNAYVKAYNGVDFITVISTQKSIKKHAYEKGKRYFYDPTIGIIKP